MCCHVCSMSESISRTSVWQAKMWLLLEQSPSSFPTSHWANIPSVSFYYGCKGYSFSSYSVYINCLLVHLVRQKNTQGCQKPCFYVITIDLDETMKFPIGSSLTHLCSLGSIIMALDNNTFYFSCFPYFLLVKS